MNDRVPVKPGRVKLAKDDGTVEYAVLTRADEPTQEGTPLNKNTLLKDSTAAMYGLTDAAVPDDVLSLLSRFNSGLGEEYFWARQTFGELLFEWKYNLSLGQYSSSRGYCRVRCADSVSFDSSGTAFLEDTQDLMFTSGDTSISTLAGKYCYTTSNADVVDTSTVYKIPEDATLSWATGSLRANNSYRVISKPETAAFLSSPDQNAYPPAVADGYMYAMLGQLGDLGTAEFVSYTGTETYGVDSPCEITFAKPPKYIRIIAKLYKGAPYHSNSALIKLNTSNCYETLPGCIGTEYQTYFPLVGSSSGYIKRSADGKTITWYSTSAGYQLNKADYTYVVMALF